MTENPLLTLRERITQLDKHLIELLAERRQISIDVVKAKIASHLPIRDIQREKDLLQQLIEKGKEYQLDAHYILRLYQLIIEDSVLLQQQILQQANESKDSQAARIAFLGPVGSYSHLATRRYAANHFDTIIECSCPNFKDVFSQAEKGFVDYAIVPIENTSSGAINDIYDLLQQTSLNIIAELYQPINHCLLVHHPDTSINDIKIIYTHPQPYQQCSHYFEQFPHWEIKFCDSSSSAMEKVASITDRDVAAVGNKDGGDFYQLHVLSNNFSNQHLNVTRFIVLARKQHLPSQHVPAKTTILITTSQQAGALVDALMILRNHNITMTKLESRPIYGNPWEEMFYIDMLGNTEDKNMQQALKALVDSVTFIKVLGCYANDSVTLPTL